MTVRIETRGDRLVVDIRTRGPDGPIRERRSVPDGVRSLSAAKRWGEARQAHLAGNGKDEEEAPEAPTFEEFGKRWERDYVKAERLKPSTADAYERILRLHLYPAIGKVRIDAIREMEIQRVKLRSAGKADKTMACILSVLDEVLKAAERWEEIAKAPKIDKPRWMDPQMEFYDFDDMDALVAGAARAGPMVLAAVLLGGDAGLRRGELVALESGDVARGAVTIQRSEWEGRTGTPKGGQSRRIPLTTRLQEALAAVKHLRGKRLLWQSNGDKVQVTTLQSWMEVATKRAGLPPSRNIHKLRHTFCSHLAMQGVPMRAIQEWAGHSDLKTTQRYMHLSPHGMDSMIHRLEGAGGEQGNEKARK